MDIKTKKKILIQQLLTIEDYEVLEKIENILKENNIESAELETDIIDDIDSLIKVNKQHAESLTLIKNTINNKQTIQFKYKQPNAGSDDINTIQTIIPKHISTNNVLKQPALIGVCCTTKNERTYSVKRISDIIPDPKEIILWTEKKHNDLPFDDDLPF